MYYVLTIALAIFLMACSSPKEQPKAEPSVAGPRVQTWLNDAKPQAANRLPVIITTSKPLSDSLLKQISPNQYTARLNQQELKKLLENPAIKKISTGKEKLH